VTTQPSNNIASERKSFLLSVLAVRSGYGKREVLKGISFHVAKKQLVALIGPNGSGKSTVLKTVFGLIQLMEGEIKFGKQIWVGHKPHKMIGSGMAYVPQGNQVFDELTVLQNLVLSQQGAKRTEEKYQLDEMASLFPVVGMHLYKRAGHLSGGEKQQVALAMGLIKKPKMLLLDEPSLGLAPNLLENVFEQLRHINKHYGVTMLIVEHKVREIFKIADRVLGLRRGEIVAEDKPEAMDDTLLKDLFLG